MLDQITCFACLVSNDNSPWGLQVHWSCNQLSTMGIPREGDLLGASIGSPTNPVNPVSQTNGPAT
jgi:hypothetical protein